MKELFKDFYFSFALISQRCSLFKNSNNTVIVKRLTKRYIKINLEANPLLLFKQLWFLQFVKNKSRKNVSFSIFIDIKYRNSRVKMFRNLVSNLFTNRTEFNIVGK